MLRLGLHHALRLTSNFPYIKFSPVDAVPPNSHFRLKFQLRWRLSMDKESKQNDQMISKQGQKREIKGAVEWGIFFVLLTSNLYC